MYLPSLTGPMRPTPLNDQVAGPLKFLRQVRDSMTFMRYANPPGCHGVYLVSALTRLDKRYPPKTTEADPASCYRAEPQLATALSCPLPPEDNPSYTLRL